jgi:hypothetical protein
MLGGSRCDGIEGIQLIRINALARCLIIGISPETKVDNSEMQFY